MSGKKQAAESFLKLASSGKVRQAYERYVHPAFAHHNAYVNGRLATPPAKAGGMSASLRSAGGSPLVYILDNPPPEGGGMREDFKGDRETLLRAMEENARKFPGKTYETLRALEDGDLIVEEWEASQEALGNTPNGNGVF